jgi:tellurite resistance protein TehA-like permease
MRLRFECGRRDDLKTLHPAYFAMVMATGIVAISAHLHDIPVVAGILFWLNALFLAGLLAATGARLLRYPRDVAADLRSHSRAVGFFTIVAALAVFGAQLDLQRGEARLAAVFWAVAAILWAVMTYGVLGLLMAKADKPRLGDGLNGGWLVIVVAPQSVVLLTVLVVSHGLLAGLAPSLMFMALVLWLVGGVLYLWITTLIFYRYTFEAMAPEDFSPADWIDMGAAAISALAGATLVQHASLSPLVAEVVPFAKGLTLFLWGIATWWIPLLMVLSAWRTLISGLPIAYGALDWSGVFPLGMYSVSTYSLMEILDAPFLAGLSMAFTIIALAAWLLTLLGFVISCLAPRQAGRGVSRQACLTGGTPILFPSFGAPGRRHSRARGTVMSEQEMTHEDQEETAAAFSDELSDEALDRAGTAFCSTRSSLAGDN